MRRRPLEMHNEEGGENPVFSPFLYKTTHAGEEGAKSMKVVFCTERSGPYFPNMMLGSQTTTSGKIVQIMTPMA
jgi:hypothetical protein